MTTPTSCSVARTELRGFIRKPKKSEPAVTPGASIAIGIEKDDFAIETSDSFLDLWKSISGTFFVVMIGIASISLVVGGIVMWIVDVLYERGKIARRTDHIEEMSMGQAIWIGFCQVLSAPREMRNRTRT